jgi:thiol:disulfide interchange protein
MSRFISHARMLLGALALAAAALPARGGESFAVNKPATAEHIDFQVDLQPWDPFSDANKVGVPREFRRGEVVRLVIHGAPRDGYHTYPLTRQFKDMKGNADSIHYRDDDALRVLWPPTETPPPEPVMEEGVGALLEYHKPFTWTQDLYIKPDAKPNSDHVLHFSVTVLLCDEHGCFPPAQHTFEVPFKIIDAPVVAPPADLAQRSQSTPPPPETLSFRGKDYTVVSTLAAANPAAPPAVAPPARGPDVPKSLETPPPTKSTPPKAMAPPAGGLWDLLGFMWQGVLWGALSLVTPCVFPMIPITVSYFLKQSERAAVPASGRREPADAALNQPAHAGRSPRPHSPILLAAVYSSTIAVVLTVAGVLLLPLVQQFSQHWATNLVLGGLFVFFALSLFGMYDIVLPSWLGRLTASGEGRGGLLGVVSMALTFTVISFACVAPFYGGFIALSASAASAADWTKLVLGALAFSVTFALPFFLLALFPFLLKALPKSGSWLNTVKVVMGFLELAAAFKFLRAAELNYFVHTEFLTYDLVLGVYVALSVACGLYLLGVYRLPHDHGAHETLSVPRLLFSVAFLGLALYLLPGLFKTGDGEQQRPQGTVFAWLDSFLLPEDTGPSAIPNTPGGAPSGRLAWVGDLQEGLKQAETDKKLVFVDFTAETCTNCKFNERNVFIKPEIKGLLGQYVLVHLYTDNVPPEYKSSTTGAQNLQLMQKAFKDASLPLYAIVRPKEGGEFELVSKPYEGKINNVEGFAKFLHDPLQAPAADARAEAKGG